MTCRLCSSLLPSGALFCTECGTAVAPAPAPASLAPPQPQRLPTSIRTADAATPATQWVPADALTSQVGRLAAPLVDDLALRTSRSITSADADTHNGPASDPVAAGCLIARLLGIGVALLLPVGAIALMSGQDLAAVIMVAALVLLVFGQITSR
ncbi:MAG TPA: hypothetical protein VFS21_30350 [Roseiflexaceae bacterium]|nr:hypothetical protein [Roseiflexaceae bacterium]